MRTFGIIIVIAYVLEQAFEYWLRTINVRHMRLHADSIPEGFECVIDAALMRKSVSYASERAALASAESAVTSVVVASILLGGLFDAFNSWVGGLQLPFVASGVVFFLLPAYGSMLLGIPFSLYATFRIEQRYGFNTMTPGLWFADLLKAAALTTILMVITLGGCFFLIGRYPASWWLPAWLFFLGFGIFLMYISPYVIEPLFNRYRPVEDALQARIREMMQKAGISVSRVFTMDASRRSRHTNAYFTGVGRVKRIVLFDTLLANLSEEEILAVLAHEAGHWKLRHVLKRIVVFELLSLAALYAACLLLQTGIISPVFGITHATAYGQAALLLFAAGVAAFPAGPLASLLSRRHEHEADRFAASLAPVPEALASALIKLSRDNLSGLHPHPLYAAWHYSHPPVVGRVRRIRANAAKRNV